MANDDRRDNELIRNAQRRPGEYAAIYRLYWKTIYRYFWYRTNHDWGLAEDLTQETFTRAFAASRDFQDQGVSYRSYLFRIAHNLLVSQYRKTTEVPIEYAEQVPGDEVGTLQRRVDMELLWWTVERLPFSERQAVILFYRYEHNVREIAQTLQKSENAIKLTLSRARKHLKTLLTASSHIVQRKRPTGPKQG